MRRASLICASLAAASSLWLGCNAISGINDYSVASSAGAAGSSGASGSSGTSGTGGTGATGGSAGTGGTGGASGTGGTGGGLSCSAKRCDSNNDCGAESPLCADSGDATVGKICVFSAGTDSTQCFDNEVPVAAADSQSYLCFPDACVAKNPPACAVPVCNSKADCKAYASDSDCVDLSDVTGGAVGKRCATVLGANEFCILDWLTYDTAVGRVCIDTTCAASCSYTVGSTSADCPNGTACERTGTCIPQFNQDGAPVGSSCSETSQNKTPCGLQGNVLQGSCLLSGGQYPLICHENCAVGTTDTCGSGETCVNAFSAAIGVCAEKPVCPNGVQEIGEECDDNNSTNGDGCNSSCKYEVDETEPNDDFSQPNTITSTMRATIIPGTDVDFFFFTSPSAGSFTAEIQPLYDAACLVADPSPKHIDTYIYVVSANGNQLAENDDISPNINRCSKVTVNLPSAGSYYVVVFGFDSVIEFPYKLQITLP
ncbi:MAG: hypothetical protein U0165_03745 [Polyangiaceae bacterium]